MRAMTASPRLNSLGLIEALPIAELAAPQAAPLRG